MFIITTIYGISAIIVGSFLAWNFDVTVKNAAHHHSVVRLFSHNARSLLLMFICFGFMMIPVLNTVFAVQTIGKLYRSTKKLFSK
jgi:hypothetical protein